ncbi:MAG: VWA domain-containing protein [Verrucomicrobiota bacterium]
MNFAHPAWFFLIALIPLLVIGALLTSRLRRAQWAEFAASRLRAALVRSQGGLHRVFAFAFLLAALAAIIIALARLQGDAGVRVEKSSGHNVMIALDLSRSMRVADVKPDRLSQAKIVIEELLDAMPDERFGLIGFAGEAYTYAPLTIDHAAVRETVAQIDETWAPTGGSNIRKAVRLAIETLKKTGQSNNALVLISDGEKHDGDLEATITEAKRAGVYILAVGVGTENGDYVPNDKLPNRRAVDRSGKPIISRLQPEVLSSLANGTNGRFAIAGTGLDIPAMVRSVIKDLDAFQSEGRKRRIAVEFYQWFVLPAIVLLMISIVVGTRWRRTAAAIPLLAMFFSIDTARGDEVAQAKRDLKAGRNEEAAHGYRNITDVPAPPVGLDDKPWLERMGHSLKKHSVTPLRERKALFEHGRGEAEYRRGDHNEAIAGFSGSLLSSDPAVRARGHFGIGNSLFQTGWFTLAAAPYSPPEKPGFETFDQLVHAYLAAITSALFAPPAEEGPSIAALKDLITNWTDAVRHFEAAAEIYGDWVSPSPRQNAELTTAYLKRLQELLKEMEQQAQQQGRMQGPGQPGEGEGGGNDEKQENDGDGDPKDGKNGDKNKDQGPPKEPDDGSGAGKDRKPGETPEEHARRKLKENSDLERGPVSPGQHELRNPEKDW